MELFFISLLKLGKITKVSIGTGGFIGCSTASLQDSLFRMAHFYSNPGTMRGKRTRNSISKDPKTLEFLLEIVYKSQFLRIIAL